MQETAHWLIFDSCKREDRPRHLRGRYLVMREQEAKVQSRAKDQKICVVAPMMSLPYFEPLGSAHEDVLIHCKVSALKYNTVDRIT